MLEANQAAGQSTVKPLMTKALQYRLREVTRDLTRLFIWAVISAAAIALIMGVGIGLIRLLSLSGFLESGVAISAFLLSMGVMLFGFGWSATLTQHVLGAPPPSAFVDMNDEEIVSSSIYRETESIRWQDLVEVSIVASDGWPIGDLNWMLITSDGGGAIVPSHAQGMDGLLKAMQERLSGFDNEAVIIAMGSLEGRFIAWREPDAASRDTQNEAAASSAIHRDLPQ